MVFMHERSVEMQSGDYDQLLKWIDYIFKIAIEAGVTKIDFSVMQKLLFLIENEAGIDLNINFTRNNRIPVIPGFSEIMKNTIKNVKIRKKRDTEHRVIDTDSLVYFDLSNGEILSQTTDILKFEGLAVATKVIQKWIDAKSADLLMYIMIFHGNTMGDLGF